MIMILIAFYMSFINSSKFIQFKRSTKAKNTLNQITHAYLKNYWFSLQTFLMFV